MTLAEADTIEAALAWRDIRLAEQAHGHVSPVLREYQELRLMKAAARVEAERKKETDQ